MNLFKLAYLETKYGVFIDPNDIQDKYGVFEPEITQPTFIQQFSSVGKVAIPIALFLIGLLVLISKKFTPKIRALAFAGITVLSVASYFLLDYLSKNP